VRLRTRLSLSFLVIAGLGFALLVDWMTDDLRPRYLETMEASMIDTATLLSSLVAQWSEAGSLHTGPLKKAIDDATHRTFEARVYEVTKDHLDMRVYVTDTNGIVVFDSDGGRDEGRDYSRWNDVWLTLRGQYGARTTRADPDDPTSSILYVASPIILDGSMLGVLTVCKPSESVTLFLDAAKRKIMAGGLLAGFSVIVVGTIVSLWIIWPIQRLTRYAQAVRDGKRAPPPQGGRGEIGTLATAFEEMRDALEGKQYVERYVQTLTHEMKSPLSAIQGAAELLDEDMPPDQRRRFIRNIRTESDRIRSLVDRMLQLSSLETRKSLRDEDTFDLAALVEDLLARAESSLASRSLVVRKELPESCPVRGERFLVRQSLNNLLQNAVDFSPHGGEIGVRLTCAGDTVEITITDQGSGIPAYAVSRVFDRFYSLKRPDTGEKSSGLGLPFVREAAALHGGEVRLENRPRGGVTAVLRLPIAR